MGGLITDFAGEFVEAYRAGDDVSEVAALQRMTELARRRQENLNIRVQEARI